MECDIKVTVYAGGKVIATVKSRTLYHIGNIYVGADTMVSLTPRQTAKVTAALTRGAL